MQNKKKNFFIGDHVRNEKSHKIYNTKGSYSIVTPLKKTPAFILAIH